MRKASIWFLLLIAGLLAACSGTKTTVKTEPLPQENSVEGNDEKKKEFEFLFIEALKQKMIGNHQKAVSLLSACLEIDPKSSAAMYELANLHILNKDMTSASLLLEKAISINPSNIWYMLSLADVYQQTGKNSEAANLFDRILKTDPQNQEYLYMKAVLLAKAKKYDESVRAFNDLEKVTGIHEQISAAKQDVYIQAGKIKEAVAEIQRLIDSDPANPRYYGLLADLYKEQGDYENALRYYTKIRELDPGNGFVFFSLADLVLEKKDSITAFEYIRQGFASDSVDLETKLQLYLMYTGDNAPLRLTSGQTEEIIRLIIKKYPDDFRVYSVYAEYLIRNKNYGEARKYLLKAVNTGANEFTLWEQVLYLDNELQDWPSLYDHGKSAIESFPNQPQFYFLRAIAALQMGKYAEAIQIADEGLLYVVENKGLQGQLIFLKGEAQYKLSKTVEAFALFDQAIELDPDNFIALNNYAYYLSLAGRDLEKAERMSGRVIERFPDNATYLDTYAWVLFRKQNYTLARFYMETALSHSETENPTLIEHYGDILFMLGKTDEAVEKWKKALELGSDSKILKQKIAEKKYIGE